MHTARIHGLRPRTLLAALAAVALTLALWPLAGPAQAHNHADRAQEPPEEGERPDEVPVQGADRFETAAAAATEAFESADTVVVATGDDFADALAGSTVAGALQAPVLLAPGDLPEDAELPQAITDALDELTPQAVQLLGGEGAISEAIAERLTEHASVEAVERVEGASRFETALEIARLAVEQDPAAGEIEINGETVRAAFLGTGLDFPDSVAAGPGAYASAAPMLLTGPDELHPAAETAIEELEIDHAFVLGGEAVISEDAAAALEARGVNVERLAGEDRWETAAAIAERLEGEGFGFDGEHVGLATGADFADALAATSYLGSAEAPLLLADEDANGELAAPAADHLEARGCEIRFLHIVGGEGAVGPQMREAARDLSQCVSGEQGEDGEDGGAPEEQPDGGSEDQSGDTEA